MTPRIFVDADGLDLAAGANYALPAPATHHLAQVLRMRPGQALALFTGTGGEYAATIVHIERGSALLRIERHHAVERESPWPVTLVQSLIAADMMDWIVRKAVELGVARIAPVKSARSQSVPVDRAARRIEHWRQIAIAACEQCGRNRVPDIAPAVSFAEWLEAHDASQPTAILDVAAKRSLAAEARAAPPRHVVIGPEGGFTAEELQRAAARGAVPVHCGRRTLRAETAALAALATIGALCGDAR